MYPALVPRLSVVASDTCTKEEWQQGKEAIGNEFIVHIHDSPLTIHDVNVQVSGMPQRRHFASLNKWYTAQECDARGDAMKNNCR